MRCARAAARILAIETIRRIPRPAMSQLLPLTSTGRSTAIMGRTGAPVPYRGDGKCEMRLICLQDPPFQATRPGGLDKDACG